MKRKLMLVRLQVRCVNYGLFGCRAAPRARAMGEHLRSYCPGRMRACPMTGCSANVRAATMEAHIRDEHFAKAKGLTFPADSILVRALAALTLFSFALNAILVMFYL